MEDDDIRLKERIVEALEPEEIQELRASIEEKEEELDNLGDFEMSEDEVDDHLDEIYPDVNLAGVTYSFSSVLKAVDEPRYNDFKCDIESQVRDEKEEMLRDDLDQMTAELDELLEANEDEE